MTITRRTAVAALATLPLAVQAAPLRKEATPMYGLIGKMRAKPGQRDALIAILLEATAGMPGCLSYGIAKDKQDPDTLWITETWVDEASHAASLSLPAVQAAITKGRPLIAGFEGFKTEPVGGHGTMSKKSA